MKTGRKGGDAVVEGAAPPEGEGWAAHQKWVGPLRESSGGSGVRGMRAGVGEGYGEQRGKKGGGVGGAKPQRQRSLRGEGRRPGHEKQVQFEGQKRRGGVRRHGDEGTYRGVRAAATV